MLALSGAAELPFGEGISMAMPTRLGCAVTGIVLIIYSLWALYGNETIRLSKKDQNLDKSNVLLNKLKQDISDKDAKILELEQLINKAKQRSLEKGYYEINDILIGIQETLTTAEDKRKILTRAADWVKVKADSNSWTDLIQAAEFDNYGINRQNVDEFRNELKQHLEALQENLEDMIPDGLPRKRGVPQTVANSRLAYKKALQIMQISIEEDLERSYELDDEAQQQIKAYVEKLIEVTDS